MYNRYINSLGEQFFTAEPDDFATDGEPVFSDNGQNYNQNGGLRGLFSRLGLTFDMDTVFLLVIVYFLVADGEDDITETLLIVAALLFLGF